MQVSMQEQIKAALERRDYAHATQLLQLWQAADPQNVWLPLCQGQLYEATEVWSAAEDSYRQVLRTSAVPRIMTLARQGLERLLQREQDQRKGAIAQALSMTEQTQLGVLVLEPLTPEAKVQAVEPFARIMGLDPLTARMQLPTRCWRFCRMGPIGELRVYGEELRARKIPAFWVALQTLDHIPILQVEYFEHLSPLPLVHYTTDGGEQGKMTFSWSEVAQQVNGRLPVFEKVFKSRHRWKTGLSDLVEFSDGEGSRFHRVEAILDYVQVWDLHLFSQGCILRLSDRHYQFRRLPDNATPNNFISSNSTSSNSTSSNSTSSNSASNNSTPNHSTSNNNGKPPSNDWSESKEPWTVMGTVRAQWNQLRQALHPYLTHTIRWDQFNPFAEQLAEHPALLEHVPLPLKLLRQRPSHWDPAFQLYSTLTFVQGKSRKAHR